MAVYSQLSAGDISSIDDMQKVRDYLYKLNKNLKYMFNNLTPEDNYSELARLTMVTDGQRQATIEATLDSISLNYVSKDNVISAINLSEGLAKIEAEKIQLEGVVTVNGYFKVGLDGSITARNGKFSGSISGSDIALGGVGGGDGYIVVYNSSGTEIGRWSKDGINVGSGSIQGADITLGGVNNINGTLTIKDATGATIGSWTKDGITATGGTFSGTITGSHIYASYYGSRSSNNFFIIAEDDVTVVGVPGFEFKNKKMSSNWIGSVENPALGNSDQAGINGNTGDAGFRKLYLLDDWYEGQDGTFWDVTRTLRWLDNRVSSLEAACWTDCDDSDDGGADDGGEVDSGEGWCDEPICNTE